MGKLQQADKCTFLFLKKVTQKSLNKKYIEKRKSAKWLYSMSAKT